MMSVAGQKVLTFGECTAQALPNTRVTAHKGARVHSSLAQAVTSTNPPDIRIPHTIKSYLLQLKS